ncbi:UNVERIFIED_CONTAM: Potassium transporter 5 [Sesamum angustifolium]|uniref:Potassium transporter n=1 Tax=Sesamum angustifolium TaxID=2727405 RepID=A0AAW2QRX5_9LAMI
MATETEHVLREESTAEVVISQEENPHLIKDKTLSWKKLRRYDSLDMAAPPPHHGGAAHKVVGVLGLVVQLAFQSIGVVYGDIGTSPLYVYSSTFGGTFALYSLVCRYAKVGLIPSEEVEDGEVSTFKLQLPNTRLQRASKVKSKLEKSNFAKLFLLFATMLGTSMVIGDGVLTPCISGGIKEATSAMTEDRIVWTSIAILVCLFMVQRFGTDKVGYSFAPIICVWFSLIAGIGVHNFIKYDPSVIKAINPKYIVDYFTRNKDQAWISLGGVVLAITGTEALFADVGHFSVRSIQMSMCTVTYPALILAYTGQASFLRKNSHLVSDTFYKSIPDPLYWPMFVVAVLASIIASQAMISGTFSIIQQSLSLGCFPRVKIVHTSTKFQGQVYVPEVNYLLMLACVFVTLGFRTTTKIGNAYGIAVVFVMTLTSAFLVLIMIMIWKTHILLIIAYALIIGTIELVYLSSVLYKFDQGGYLPLAFALILMTIMYVWNNVYRKKYYFELDHKISPEKVKEIVQDLSTSQRLPGLAIFYSELVHGIPPIFKHYVANVPALHSVLVFVSFKSLPISKVPMDERFLFRRVQPKDIHVYRCIVRYGYKDVRNEQEPFEKLLVEKLKEFIREDYCMGLAMIRNSVDFVRNEEVESGEDEVHGETQDDEIAKKEEEMERDMADLDRAWRSGVVHLVGEHEVVAGKGANIGKRVLIDYAYNFLKKNLRQSNKVFDIPHKRMLKVGMTYEL